MFCERLGEVGMQRVLNDVGQDGTVQWVHAVRLRHLRELAPHQCSAFESQTKLGGCKG